MLNLALYNNETEGPLRRLEKLDGQERQLELNAYDVKGLSKNDGAPPHHPTLLARARRGLHLGPPSHVRALVPGRAARAATHLR